MKKMTWVDYLLALAIGITLVAVIIGLPGCFGRPALPPAPQELTGPPAPTGTGNATVDYLRLLVRWICAGCLLLGFLGAGAAVWLRSAALGLLAATCFGGLALGLFTDWMLAHYIVGVVLIGVAVFGTVAVVLWHAYVRGKGLEGAIKVAEYLKPTGMESDEAKAIRKAEQARLAGKGAKVIDRFRTKLLKQQKATSKPPSVPT